MQGIQFKILIQLARFMYELNYSKLLYFGKSLNSMKIILLFFPHHAALASKYGSSILFSIVALLETEISFYG
jgi:hypothetical protein